MKSLMNMYFLEKSHMKKSVWILEPVNNFINFIGEEVRNNGLLKRALTHLELGQPLLELGAQRVLEIGDMATVDALKRLLEASPYQEKWARELRELDYAQINSHSLVAMWGALETCIEDTVISIIINNAGKLTDIEKNGVKVIRDGNNNINDEEASAIYRRLERKRESKGNIIATYENVLNFFELTANPLLTEEILVELNAIRNCIMHKGGVIDQKAANQAPKLKKHLGNKYLINTEEYLKYYDAISTYALELMRSVTSSSYAKE